MKKAAFTLAEILIVLIVIGIISAIVIPAVLKNAMESKYISCYKKAYHTIINIIAMENVAGNLVNKPNKENVASIFEAIATGSAVKGYANIDSTNKYFDSKILSASDFKSCLVFKNKSDKTTVYPADSKIGDCAGSTSFVDATPWIIGEDNISFSVTLPESAECLTREQINSKKTFSQAYSASCAIVVVDTNGLNNGPNTVEAQLSDSFNAKTEMGQLLGDRYYIFIGKNGATAGNESSLLTGRMISGIK